MCALRDSISDDFSAMRERSCATVLGSVKSMVLVAGSASELVYMSILA